MTGGNSSRVATKAQAGLLLDPEHYLFISALMRRAWGAAELARELDMPLSRVHYLLGKFVAAGLAEISEVTPRPGRPIKRYRMHGDWFVPFELTDAATLEELLAGQLVPRIEQIVRLLVAQLREDRPDLGSRLFMQGQQLSVNVVTANGETLPGGRPSLDSLSSVLLTREQAFELQRRLLDTVREFADEATAKDATPFILGLFLVEGELR